MTLWSPLKLVALTVVFVVLFEILTARESPEPEEQIWAVVAAEFSAIDSVHFSPDGHTLATVDAIGHAALRDASTGQWKESQPASDLVADCQWTVRTGHGGRVGAVAFSPAGRTLVSGRNDRAIRLWDVSELTSMRGRHRDRADDRGARDGKSP
jgi:WD40 repeat protein